jgi:parallel beta-helix repeat protein
VDGGTGGDVIDFALGSGPTITFKGSPLPAITEPTLIDGYAENNDSPGVFVELNGSGVTGDGLTVDANGVTIRGLAIDRFSGNGITLNNPSGTTGDSVYYDNIGTDLTGSTAGLGNGGDGIYVEGANNTIGSSPTIGGPLIGRSLGGPTIISGNNGNGVNYTGSLTQGNSLQNCYIGTDKTGLTPLPNTQSGVAIQNGAQFNTVSGNVISGNKAAGVSIGASNGTVLGNTIGLGSDGKTSVSNGADGIALTGAAGNTIGSGSAGNVISSNGRNGILISGGGSSRNLILGNRIGTTLDGLSPRGNTLDGVFLTASILNTIGGAAAGQLNVISGNGGNGVEMDELAVGNVVIANYIGTNSGGGAAIGNTNYGVYIQGTNNTIGGNTSAQMNVISGNGKDGVSITDAGNDTGSNNLVAANYIGTNMNGSVAIANIGYGISIAGNNNTVGVTVANVHNIISGNNLAGIELAGDSNLVINALVGTDKDGAKPIANVQNGIELGSEGAATNNTIGGFAANTRNVISGNGTTGQANKDSGIFITNRGGSPSTGNLVEGNYIGTDANGLKPLGNGNAGVYIDVNVEGNTIGGAPGAFNVISANGTEYKAGSDLAGDGVYLAGGTTNNVVTNNIIGFDKTGADPNKNMANKHLWLEDVGIKNGNTTTPNTHN